MADVRAAEGRMNAAYERLQKLAGSNAPLGGKQGAENSYGAAYQVLVRMGARRQLRGKYRGQ